MRTGLVVVLTIFLLSCLNIKAQESVLHLQMHDKSPFSLVLNDVHFKDIRTSYTIRNVPPGVHLLKIVKPRANRKTGRIIFADYIRIPEGKEIFAYLDSDKIFRVHDAKDLYAERKSSQRPDDPYISDNRNQTITPENKQPSNQTKVETETSANTPAPGMNSAVFNQLKSEVKEQSYDDTRLSMSKNAISGENKINCAQLGELIDVFSFEVGKLELTKYAYPYLTDKDSFTGLFNRFKFESSKAELSKLGSNK